ncbi:hypothetical protein [Sabulibacter ruber]|uniref:hypothetical protein n=1 Tax=Sabulibacter ruber TaxID=2811901 RepID=UPI001A97263B|nr:hypothetical protein [Sabulibacter ruber]
MTNIAFSAGSRTGHATPAEPFVPLFPFDLAFAFVLCCRRCAYFFPLTLGLPNGDAVLSVISGKQVKNKRVCFS